MIPNIFDTIFDLTHDGKLPWESNDGLTFKFSVFGFDLTVKPWGDASLEQAIMIVDHQSIRRVFFSPLLFRLLQKQYDERSEQTSDDFFVGFANILEGFR